MKRVRKWTQVAPLKENIPKKCCCSFVLCPNEGGGRAMPKLREVIWTKSKKTAAFFGMSSLTQNSLARFQGSELAERVAPTRDSAEEERH